MCEEIRQAILEHTLEGEPIAPDSPLGAHLRQCPDCQRYHEAIVQVDTALQAMPLQAAPSWIVERVLARIEPNREQPFLPWTVWVPLLSLFAGFAWAYAAFVWTRSAQIAPTVAVWPTQLEIWLSTHQGALGALSLSVVLGLIFSVLGVGVGFYVGRERRATAER